MISTLSDDQAKAVSTPNADALLGQTIGPYVIAARVGGGGMGVVYQAKDTKLGRTVALKFLPPQWSHDQDARQRFIREAQAASATNHPNICTIHDVVTAPDGQLFIVMAYYEGQTLKQRLAAGSMAVEEALDIATQIADGLAKAHAQGVVHRDVKPGNVILTEDGIRIVDFGLATFADALKLTVEHSTLGTAAYMSPEQVRGQSADARSDVWAVGVVLYEMLTGHVPFQGSHAEAIAYAVRNEAAAPIRRVRPEISEEIEQLVFRAMHKEPSIRFANGRDLARALRQVRGQSMPPDLRTEPVPRPTPKPTSSDMGRFRWRPWAAAAVALVLIVAVAAAWLAWPVDRTSIVVAPFGNQTGDTDLEQYRLALTQTLTLSLSDARDLKMVPYSRVLEILRRFLDQRADVSNRDAIQAISANTGAALVVVPTLLRDGGAWRARVELRDPRTSNSIWEHETDPETSSLTRDVAYRMTLRLATDIEAHLKGRRSSVVEALMGFLPFGHRDRPGRMRSLEAVKAFAEGAAWYDDYEYARARQAFRMAVDFDSTNPLLLSWLSRAAQLVKDENEATETANRAVSLLTPQTSNVDALFVRAVAAEASRDMEAAELAFRVLVDERPDDPTWAMELGGFFDRQARRADAVVAYHQALMLDQGLLRPRLELCRLYNPARLNEPAEARTHGEAALAGYRALGARGGEGQSLLCLVDTLTVGKDEEKRQARVHAQAAHKIFQELGYQFNVALAEYYEAYVAGTQGQFAESVALGEIALADARKAGNLVAAGTTMTNLGAAHVAIGNWMEGAEYYAQAYKLYQGWRDESRAAQIQANRGALLIDYGSPKEGLADVQNALPILERLGDRRFQTFCLRVIATYYRNQGRLEEATRELNKGLAIARERNLVDNVTVMTTLLAQTQFDDGDYDSARRSLLEALKSGTGRRSTEARIRLARTYIHLGDLAAADGELQTADRELTASPNNALRSLFWLVRGEWSKESNRATDAHASFEKASTYWVEALPEPSAVEARGYLGFVSVGEGKTDAGRRLLQSSIEAARKLAHRSLEARTRLLLAETEIASGRLKQAADALNAIPPDDATQTIGPELRARVHSLWVRHHTALGNTDDAVRSAQAARMSIGSILERLPENYRASFAARAIVQRVQN
jgi:serine/threonine protein kinase/tetratricopeptide (TPR) repeat protein